jgi:hypothetical protein
MAAINSTAPPANWEGIGYAAACYALAGKIDAADRAIMQGIRSANGQLDPGLRAQAVNIVFEIGHPVADAGDYRSAGPMMELVLKYWPQNYMAMYHALESRLTRIKHLKCCLKFSSALSRSLNSSFELLVSGRQVQVQCQQLKSWLVIQSAEYYF